MNKKEKAKFDDLDRERVIDAIQEHYSVKLLKVTRRAKWLRDDSGKIWWVLGGVGDWHSIPKEMIESEKDSMCEGMLVMTEKKRSTLEVFVGPLNQLVISRSKLSRDNKTGSYHFTVRVRGKHIQCEQVPEVLLQRILSISHSDEDRERKRRTKQVSKLIASLSPEQISELLSELENEDGELSDH